MHSFVFAGISAQPCYANFGVWVEQADPMPIAHLVVVQSLADGGTVLHGHDGLLTQVLNTLLARELPHVRIEFVRFHVILQTGETPVGFEYPIEVDAARWVTKNLPHNLEDHGSPLIAAFRKRWCLNQEAAGQSITIDSNDLTGEKGVFYVEWGARVPLELARVTHYLHQIR